MAAIEAPGRTAVALHLDTAATGTFGEFADTLKSTLQDRWGRDRFDFLVNNAGTSYHNGVEKTTEAELDALYNVQLKGVFFLTQKLLPSSTTEAESSICHRVSLGSSIPGAVHTPS